MHHEHGDTFQMMFPGGQRWFWFSTPAAARAIFTAPLDAVYAGKANKEVVGPIVGDGGVITLDANPHLSRRKLLMPPFRGERMHTYGALSCALTAERVDGWRSAAVFSLLGELQGLTLAVIMRAVFGVDLESNPPLANALARVATECVGSPLLMMKPLQKDWGRLSPWGRLMHILREADALLFAEIAARRRAPTREDIMSMLLAITTEDGEPLSDLDLRNELMTLLLAGHETTSSSLTWVFERLSNEPWALAAVQQEIDAVCGSRDVAVEDLPKLVYLDAVIKESMRMHPILANTGSRQAQLPLTIDGVEVSPGDFVTVSAAALHYRPDVYPEPERFLPERFVDRAPDPYAWLPFGGGSRRCLGIHFALYQMKCLAAVILQRVRLSAVDDSPPVPRGFFVLPKHGLRVRVHPRQRSQRQVAA